MTGVSGPVRPARLIASALLLLLLTACQPAPDPARLRTDVAEALAARTPPGLLRAESVTVLDSRRERQNRHIHFTATLKLSRDHAFGAWDQFNAPALAAVLGAAPEDLEGINPRSNAAGDMITVEGHAIYDVDAKGRWTLRRFGPQPPHPPARWPRLRDEAWAVGRALIAAPETWRTIRDNFVWAVTRSRAQLARAWGGFAIAGGPPGSDGWNIIDALGRSEAPRRPVVNLATRNDTEILRMITEGAATAGILDSDRAQAAALAAPDLRAVAALYPKPLHIMVRADGPIASLVELRGKRIVLADDSARLPGEALRVYRLSAATATVTTLPLAEAMDALAAGKAEAVLAMVRVPDDRLVTAMSRHPIRLIALDGDAIALLSTGENRNLTINIPARSYPGQPNPVATVAVVALLTASTGVPESEIAALLRSLFGPVDFLESGSAAGLQINPATARTGLTLPLHPGAESFFGVAGDDR